ncbi:alkaline phosphatase family protein [Halorubrum sp. AD140]|uniref:alkaline phosphatase family protein n=1 Tax=Halorubrum sp. AD140 TaxID=3050073 RepID=UPI002ACCED6E|nr:alkaline phosphatase family protein [Halorubrum sp. AD140]MDZ5810214.1 alkaline phosphatase family protein [Halorubrum sp. AD140]
MGDPSRSGVDVLVIGVDALCHGVLSRLSPDTTPTIHRLVEAGASGPLESQLPPWTPSAWPSIYTGVNPGKHGVFGFLRFEGYDWDVVNATDVREHAVWELLSDHGHRSVVVNVPVTHPPAAFDGALIPGYTAPADPACHPEGLLSEVRDEIGGYRLYNEQLVEGATRDQRVDGYEEVVGMRGRAFRYLLDRERPAFGFLQFQQSDTVFHEFPDDDEAVERVFRAIDEEIAETLAVADPDATLLVSDHGIGPIGDVEFRPNAYLRDRGDVVTSAAAEKPSWSQLSRERLRGGVDDGGEQGDDASLPVAVAERALAAMAGLGLTSQRIGTVLATLGLDDAVVRLVPGDLVRAGSEHVDFAASRAYMRDRIELGIRINLAGREPEGTVDPSEYRSLRESLIGELSDLRTPAGDAVFDDVLAREEVYDGPYVEEAPDVLVVPRNFDVYLSSTVRDQPFGSPRESWSHKLCGIVAVNGREIPASDLRGAHLYDVTPTVLSLLGVPVSDRMDGSALPVVEETERASPPPYEGDSEPTDDAAVEDRLSNLGYLE